MTPPATPPTLLVKRLDHARGELPGYQTEGSAGLDLRAGISDPVRIESGARELIPTGLEIAVPPGYEAQVRPRSGLAIKHGVTVVNSPGTIDSDYRGEVGVILINHGAPSFEVTPGMRIAQLVVAPVARVALTEVAELDATERGAGGFGHTGT